MKVKYSYVLLLLILLLCNCVLNAQDTKDKYEELNTLIKSKKENTTRIKVIQEQLDVFRKKSDTLNIANAYFILYNLKEENDIIYLDSLISITKNKKYNRYPAIGYLYKGNVNYELGNYIEALEFYIKTSEAAKESGNDELHQSAKYSIGLLKNNAGDREESQAIFVDYISFLEQNPKYKNHFKYNAALFSLADSYIHTKDLDLADIFINKGIQETLKTNDSLFYSYILVTSGIHQYLLNNHYKAIDSLEKGKKIIRRLDPIETRIATCDYYIGKSYKSLGDKERSIFYFQKVDTTLRQTKDIIPEIIDVYDYLRAYAKAKDDYQLQIEYISTQLNLDSIRHANQVYLTKNITRKYEAAELVSEKERLIVGLQTKNNKSYYILLVSIGVIAVIAMFLIFHYYKHQQYRVRFEELINNNEKKTDLEKIKTDTSIGIAEEIVEIILQSLSKFENTNGFRKKNLTSSILASKLNTNMKYLTKVIKFHKQKSFTQYINDLRIEYIINRLKEDKKIQKYTIKALAKEAGFNSAEVFSKSFFKKTGIYPSYFVKSLKTHKN